jgi:DNA-binding transcriptional MerR regulator
VPRTPAPCCLSDRDFAITTYTRFVARNRGLIQIGEVAERVGLSLRTIRYYEEVGLVSPSDRSQGGFRLYSEDDVQRLAVLKGMKPLGLSLREIRQLMDLLDRSIDPEPLNPLELEEIATKLAEFLELADGRVAKLVLHVTEARKLRRRIEDHWLQCTAALVDRVSSKAHRETATERLPR